MGMHQEIVWVVECDKCHETEDVEWYATREQARTDFLSRGWTQEGETLWYCEECSK